MRGERGTATIPPPFVQQRISLVLVSVNPRNKARVVVDIRKMVMRIGDNVVDFNTVFMGRKGVYQVKNKGVQVTDSSRTITGRRARGIYGVLEESSGPNANRSYFLLPTCPHTRPDPTKPGRPKWFWSVLANANEPSH